MNDLGGKPNSRPPPATVKCWQEFVSIVAFDIRRRRKADRHPSQEVHVAPLGWEHDRIVEPFLPHGDQPATYKPHRLILVVPNLQGARDYPSRIKATLQNVCPVEVVDVPRTSPSGEFIEFDSVVAGMAKVLARELHDGNRVFVNISGGSKLTGFAAGLASMAYVRDETGAFYYVQPDHYARTEEEEVEHGMGVGFSQVIEFPPLAVGAPTMPRVWALAFLGEAKEQVGPVDLLRFLSRVPDSGLDDLDFTALDERRSRYVGGSREEDSKARMRLKRSYLDPLQEEDYIEMKRRGRNRIVTLTPKGRMYARLAPPTTSLAEDAN